MLYVTSIDGLQVEPLSKFNKFKMEQEVNGEFKISFISFNLPDNTGHDLLTEESIVTVDDFDFRVKQLTENQFTKTVTAMSTFFDLTDERQDEIYGGTHTFNEFATFVFKNTGWVFTSDITETRFIENFGNANVVTLVNALCSAFKCEYEIVANNHIHFAYSIGGDNDAVYRYKNNIKALSRDVDASKMKTYIQGYGANGLYVEYTSPNASTFGIKKADPIIDDRYTESESLLEHIKSELIDYPETSIELDSVELINKELGEKILLIYEPLEIEYQTRVLKQNKEFRGNQLVTTSVVLGNALPKTTKELLVTQKVNIDENKKEYRSKFTQTNERISLEVEAVNSSITTLDLKADGIATSVTNLETDMNSKISQTASEIRFEVSATKSELESDISTVSQTATQIQSTVSSLDTRLGNAESTITQQANQISTKITEGEAESIFYQTANSFTFDASQINFNGHIFGQGATFSGNIETSQSIYVGANITMQGDSGGRIRFPATGCWISASSTGNMTVEAWNNIDFVADEVDFGSVGTVDLSGTDLIGVPESATSGLGFSYSSAGRLYIRMNGTAVAYINVTEEL